MDVAAESTTPDNTYSIELSNGPSAFKEIYYAHGRGNIFTYPHTGNPIRVVAVSIMASEFFYLSASSHQGAYIVGFAISLLVATVYLGVFLLRAPSYFEWKRGVKTYLRKLEEIGNHQLKLNPLTFELINKKETVIEKWSSIKKVSLTPELITLNSESGSPYMFPAKTMDPSNYQVLQDFIRKQMHGTSPPIPS